MRYALKLAFIDERYVIGRIGGADPALFHADRRHSTKPPSMERVFAFESDDPLRRNCHRPWSGMVLSADQRIVDT